MLQRVVDARSFKTEPIDYKTIKQFKGEVIKDMSLFLSPFGIEIETDKAIYQVYETSTGMKVAERTTWEETAEEAPWCVYPEREECRGCEHSYAPELHDGGCKLMKFER